MGYEGRFYFCLQWKVIKQKRQEQRFDHVYGGKGKNVWIVKFRLNHTQISGLNKTEVYLCLPKKSRDTVQTSLGVPGDHRSQLLPSSIWRLLHAEDVCWRFRHHVHISDKKRGWGSKETESTSLQTRVSSCKNPPGAPAKDLHMQLLGNP